MKVKTPSIEVTARVTLELPKTLVFDGVHTFAGRGKDQCVKITHCHLIDLSIVKLIQLEDFLIEFLL